MNISYINIHHFVTYNLTLSSYDSSKLWPVNVRMNNVVDLIDYKMMVDS